MAAPLLALWRGLLLSPRGLPPQAELGDNLSDWRVWLLVILVVVALAVMIYFGQRDQGLSVPAPDSSKVPLPEMGRTV